MTQILTIAEAREAARTIVRTYVRSGRQWDGHTLESALPRGWRLMVGALFSGAPTITALTGFFRAEAVPDAD